MEDNYTQWKNGNTQMNEVNSLHERMVVRTHFTALFMFLVVHVVVLVLVLHVASPGIMIRAEEVPEKFKPIEDHNLIKVTSNDADVDLLVNDPGPGKRNHLLYQPCEGFKMVVTAGQGMGMTNQFDLIVNAIFLGVKTGRNVCIHGFRPQFNRHTFIHIGWILDLPLINKLIHNYMGPYGNNTITVAQAGFQHIKEATCYVIHGAGSGNGPRNCFGSRKYLNVHNVDANFTALLPFLLQYDHNISETVTFTAGFPYYRHSLGAVYGVNGSISDDDRCLQMIRNMLRFNPVFYDTAHTIREIAGIPAGSKYSALHYRLEDDALDNLYTTTWWAYEELPHVVAQGIKFQWSKPEYEIYLFVKFFEYIKKFIPADDEVYICSGVGKSALFKERLDFTMEILKNQFKNLRVGDMHYANQRGQAYVSEVAITGREVEAIIDYIIGVEANNFVGIEFSSFSVSIARQIAQRAGTAYHLFDVNNMGLPEKLPETADELNSLLSVEGAFNGTHIVSLYKGSMVGKKVRSPFPRIPLP
jgi:hypothetical protein